MQMPLEPMRDDPPDCNGLRQRRLDIGAAHHSRRTRRWHVGLRPPTCCKCPLIIPNQLQALRLCVVLRHPDEVFACMGVRQQWPQSMGHLSGLTDACSPV